MKGGILGWSPKQIMTGEVVRYKFVLFLLAVIAKYPKMVRHAIVCWRGRKEQLHLGQVEMHRVDISFMLWTPGVL